MSAAAQALGEADAHYAAGRYAEALDTYRRLADSDPYVWAQIGACHGALRDYPAAIAAYREALGRDPLRDTLHINIARPLHRLGRADEAAAHLETAIALSGSLVAHGNLATIAPGVPAYSLARIREVRCAFAAALAKARGSGASTSQTTPEPPPPPRGDRPCIAYISAHFDQPAYMGPVWAAINHHDRSRFDLVLVADCHADAPFHGYAPQPGDRLVEAAALDDAALAARLRALGVDLLIDLSGYSHLPRLGLYLRRAAPAVCTWFNSFSTTGLPGIDCIIGDAHVVRPGEEPFYTERVLRLPQSYLSYLPYAGRPPVLPPPCTLGAPFTFGSLVSLYKIAPPVLDAWAAILGRAPHARLVIGGSNLDIDTNRRHLLDAFAARGIDPARIEVRPPAPHDKFLRYYDHIDLALDAFPYSGGTTTMEAIWQGVPVLTHAGAGWAARTTGSILADTHLADFCCDGVASYIARAAALANDPETPAQLAVLRATMRARLLQSRALDAPALARGLESLYDGMLARILGTRNSIRP